MPFQWPREFDRCIVCHLRMVSISMAIVDTHITHSNGISIEDLYLYSKPKFDPFENLLLERIYYN